jgi:hypothetical protein
MSFRMRSSHRFVGTNPAPLQQDPQRTPSEEEKKNNENGDEEQKDQVPVHQPQKKPDVKSGSIRHNILAQADFY